MDINEVQDVLESMEALSIYLESHHDDRLKQRFSALLDELANRSNGSLEGVAYYGTYQPNDACLMGDIIKTKMDICDTFLKARLESVGLFGNEAYKHTVDAICEQIIKKNEKSAPFDIINLLKTPLPIEWPNTTTEDIKPHIKLVQLDVFLGLFWHYECAFREDNLNRVRTGRPFIPHATFSELDKTLDIHMASMTSVTPRTVPSEPNMWNHKNVVPVVGLGALALGLGVVSSRLMSLDDANRIFALTASRIRSSIKGSSDIHIPPISSNHEANERLQHIEDTVLSQAGVKDLIKECIAQRCNDKDDDVRDALTLPDNADTVARAEQLLILLGELRDKGWSDSNKTFAPMVFRTIKEVEELKQPQADILLRSFDKAVVHMKY
jgi:hypothetical protein